MLVPFHVSFGMKDNGKPPTRRMRPPRKGAGKDPSQQGRISGISPTRSDLEDPGRSMLPFTVTQIRSQGRNLKSSCFSRHKNVFRRNLSSDPCSILSFLLTIVFRYLLLDPPMGRVDQKTPSHYFRATSKGNRRRSETNY